MHTHSGSGSRYCPRYTQIPSGCHFFSVLCCPQIGASSFAITVIHFGTPILQPNFDFNQYCRERGRGEFLRRRSVEPISSLYQIQRFGLYSRGIESRVGIRGQLRIELNISRRGASSLESIFERALCLNARFS